MDNICHTLVGAALAQTGLKRRTRFGTATLLIGANLPDVDILSYAFGGGLRALSFRRGWTHGVLAMVVLPLALTGLVLLWHRAFGARDGGGGTPPLRADQVALLAALATLTHPLLDFMNTYGMRWFMPFVNRWYYADGLFIVDPWVWAVLATGVFLASTGKRAGQGSDALPDARGKPAMVALAVVAAYAMVMVGGSAMARRLVERELRAQGSPVERVMASPAPLNPFRRLIVIQDGEVYRFGVVNWLLRPVFSLDPFVAAVDVAPAAARLAAQTPEGRAFLGWARFPFFVVEPARSPSVVHIVDARYTVDPKADFGAVTIRLPAMTGPGEPTPSR